MTVTSLKGRASADTVICGRCGGSVALAALTARVACPFCQAEIQLSREALAALARYQAQVQDQLARAEQERGYAERWNQWYGSGEARKKSHPLVAVVVWLLLVIPLALLGYAAEALGLSGQTIGTVMPIALFSLFVIVIGGYLVWFYSGRRRARLPSAIDAAAVRCPSCGAPQALRPGEVLDRCRFCMAPLMPDEAVMNHGRAEADRTLLLAQIERSRAERRGMTAISSWSAANAVPYIVLGSFLPMTLFGSVGFTISWLSGNEPDTPLGGIALLWGVAGVNIGAIALVYAYRRLRQDRLEHMARTLSLCIGGTRLSDRWAVNAWFDRHWAGSVPIEQLFPGPYFAAVAGGLEGYPVLFVLNPVGASEHYRGFVSLRIGAWLVAPEQLSIHPSFTLARQRLGAFGFSLEATRAGCVALALQKAAQQLVKSGDGRALSEAVSNLPRALREAGATAVDIP